MKKTGFNNFILLLLPLFGGLIFSCQHETLEKPNPDRFTKSVVAEGLNEPVVFEILPDGRIVVAERRGKIKVIDPLTQTTRVIADLNVNVGYLDEAGEELDANGEDGILGMAFDPAFDRSRWIYIYYSPRERRQGSVVARFDWKGDNIDTSSRKILLEVPNQRLECCHLGGGMVFDGNGNLYIASGENAHGLNELPGSLKDAEATSANTNDLRGKILRIHPEPDGTYTIPEGNLFPKEQAKTRPEIYTMGHRNPMRLTIDSKTGWLYWGEVGPEGAEDIDSVGPRAYDEFNLARKPGNYGWPLISGDNKAYWRSDYATNKPLYEFDALHPKNLSPNNTGLTDLPPAQPALIWYPQTESAEFPLLGSGANSAMGGPIYHRSDLKNPTRPFPVYYEGKWFVTDYIRGWIMVISFNDDGSYKSMEPFLPDLSLKGPVDMKFGPNGDLYIIEYGYTPYNYNPDARILKIAYSKGNRKPVARMSADRKSGAVPLDVHFSSSDTKDYDDDSLTYRWEVSSAGKPLRNFSAPDPVITFSEPGRYRVMLAVRDAEGEEDTCSMEIVAGNDPPAVKIAFSETNKSFFFVGDTIRYWTEVIDREDGSLAGRQIAPTQVELSVDYFRVDGSFPDITPTLTNTNALTPVRTVIADALINQSDCRTCHQLDTRLVGPSFTEISHRYQKADTALNYLKTKIISGGNGVWGGAMGMPAHPGITEDAAYAIAEYILDLRGGGEGSLNHLPLSGTYIVRNPNQPTPKAEGHHWFSNVFNGFRLKNSGRVVFRASYRDKGTKEAPSQSAVEVILLRDPVIHVTEADKLEAMERKNDFNPNYTTVSPQRSGAWLGLNRIDLTGIRRMAFDFSVSPGEGVSPWSIEVRIGSPNGKLIAKIPVIPSVKNASGKEIPQVEADVDTIGGTHDLYVVFVCPGTASSGRVQLRTIRFSR